MRFLLVLFVATLSCCKVVRTSSVPHVTLEHIVETEIGPNAIIEKNKSNTFALAHQTRDKSVEYIAVRLVDMKVVTKEKIQGSVTWIEDLRIKVARTPGMVKLDSKPEDNVRVIDLSKYVIQEK